MITKRFYKFTGNYLPILNKLVCEYCGFTIDQDDPFFEIKKAKHEYWHSHSSYFGRASRNYTKGEPKWI